ncbi:MAG: F0F1 ATP synthase subunit gamma [Novosphingobium sp.]|nr:F0F1 ATP synthase subunit gamma [Novosphingobium sp.]
MEHLVNMRRRIKSIDITKKITNAMRLISMSMHTNLKDKKSNLEHYKSTFHRLWSDISCALNQSKINKDVDNIDKNDFKKKPNLIILVGSQKGLCGVFNVTLFKFFEEYNLSESDNIITVSKYAYDYVKNNGYELFENYNNFSVSTFVHISQSITNIILKNLNSYNQILLFSNYSRTFFIQEPRKNVIYPFDINNNLNTNNINKSDVNKTQVTDYIFEQSAQELHKTIEQFIISINIQDLLYESLLSEQAARFLSMDSATQNAQNLLNDMKLEYNKMRQANITRELTELSISFNQI